MKKNRKKDVCFDAYCSRCGRIVQWIVKGIRTLKNGKKKYTASCFWCKKVNTHFEDNVDV